MIRNIDLDGGEPKPSNTGAAEGESETTSTETTNSRGDYTGTKSQLWNWHGGGILLNRFDKNGKTYEVRSTAGWYTNREYDKLLKTGLQISLAGQAAGFLGLYANEISGHNWTDEEKANVANTPLGSYIKTASDAGLLQLAASAKAFANGRASYVSGKIDFAPVNVEDFVGVGIILKAAAKGVASGAAKEGISNSRALGIAGEEAVGVGSKTRIPSLTGTAKYRVPDELTSTTLGEVKNVSRLSLTKQLKDFHLYAQQTGRQFILYTRPNTTFTTPLQKLIDNRSIITKKIPF